MCPVTEGGDTVALSDYEKEVLAELEAEFKADRSDEAKSTVRAAQQFTVHTGSGKREPAGRIAFSPRRIAVGLILAVCGLSGILVAVSMGYSLLSILGGVASFAVSVAGLFYALQSPSRGKNRRPKKTATTQPRASWWQRFMYNQERRWDERDRF